jgi:hypothetical protein
MLINGSCHCGNLSFRLNWQPEPGVILARACTCSFCRKQGAVWTSCPTGSLAITVRDHSRLSQYSFATRTARFHVCAVCGGVPVATSQIDHRLYAVVNVNAFENVEPSLLSTVTASLNDEDESTRVTRRARSWIADVRYIDNDT